MNISKINAICCTKYSLQTVAGVLIIGCMSIHSLLPWYRSMKVRQDTATLTPWLLRPALQSVVEFEDNVKSSAICCPCLLLRL